MDIQLPGMLYLRFLTSPYPHAEIKQMDTSRAEAFPGVRAVLRYDDPELPAEADLGGHAPSALPVLPRVAHFEGEEVGAAVLADSEAIAEEAIRLIHVEWEIRPFVLDPEEALLPDAPLANPEYVSGQAITTTRACWMWKNWGMWRKDLLRPTPSLNSSQKGVSTPGSGRNVPVGYFSWNGEYPEVWVKQQRPQICKRVISSWFGGIPMNRIQLHCPYQGASFGGWSQMPWNMGGHYCAGLLAKRTGRPVKWTF